MTRKQKKLLWRILIAAAGTAALQLLPVSGVLRALLYGAVYLLIGGDVLKRAGRGILNRRMFDENFLMASATVGAIILAVWSGSGDYLEAVAVMLLYQVGELFQSFAVGKSRRSIAELMDIRPDHANLEQEGAIVQADPDEVEIGSVLVVRPGERVPIDGVIVSGRAAVDTAALTGESIPRDVSEEDEVLSGCIVMDGVLRIRTTKEFGESTAAKILDLVENASSRKSKSEAFISKFARVYTPAVCYAALVLALLPPLWRLIVLDVAPLWGDWIYRALSFLVVSCPCALLISIPLSFFAGLGGAGKAGILIKGSNYLETLSKTCCVVFDKTGTLTEGTFAVSGVHHNRREEKELLEYAALAESASTHPISRSLQKAHGRTLDRSRVGEVREFGGSGVVAVIDGKTVAVGNDKLMQKFHVPYRECHMAGTVIHVAIDGVYEGHILISDQIKAQSKAAVEALRKQGVYQTVMLTGDAQRVAEQVARTIGIEEVHSELLPADKVDEVEKLLQQMPQQGKLAFVGDGINDAPVLSCADIGIAMGALGSDAAIEAADVVLMDDDPRKIAQAIAVSRKCLRIVHENIVFTLGIKAVCLLLIALGFAGMGLAVFADVGVMILVVLNAMRAMFVKNL